MIVRGEQKAYYQQAEGELSIILSNFDTEFIYGTISDFIAARTNEFSLSPKSNYVVALELSFKDMLATYPADKENIIYVRQATYKEIIDIISNQIGIKLVYVEDQVDLFTLAKSLYDLLISNYDIHVFNFLYNFIVIQKDYIYNFLNLDKNKKNKDISTIYNKQLYSDIKLAIVNANLDYCIKSICTGIDFTTEQILSFMYYNKQQTTMQFLLNYLDPSADLFEIMVRPLLDNPYTYASLSTNIKLEIQKNNVASDGEYHSVY